MHEDWFITGTLGELQEQLELTGLAEGWFVTSADTILITKFDEVRYMAQIWNSPTARATITAILGLSVTELHDVVLPNS